MKWLSRKLLVVVLTGIINLLLATGYLHTDITALVLALIDGLAGLYVIVQGIIDALKTK